MYQISLSIKMIDDPFIDLKKAHKRKMCVYVAAFSTSIVIIGLLCFGLCFYSDDKEKSLDFENAFLIIVYFLMPTVYILTLMHLKNAMKRLIETQIDSERRSVLIQFGFFVTSYVTRLPFFLVQMFVMGHELGKNNFGWQITTCVFYFPWSILPIGYILLCHAKTYK